MPIKLAVSSVVLHQKPGAGASASSTTMTSSPRACHGHRVLFFLSMKFLSSSSRIPSPTDSRSKLEPTHRPASASFAIRRSDRCSPRSPSRSHRRPCSSPPRPRATLVQPPQRLAAGSRWSFVRLRVQPRTSALPHRPPCSSGTGATPMLLRPSTCSTPSSSGPVPLPCPVSNQRRSSAPSRALS
jgi:hypothetical protein